MTSGKDALKWVADGKVLPDLILLDCMMPGMSGTPLLPHVIIALLLGLGRAQRAVRGGGGGEGGACRGKGRVMFDFAPHVIIVLLLGRDQRADWGWGGRGGAAGASGASCLIVQPMSSL